MTRRTSIVEQVGAYFASKGRPMTADEYKNAEDAPIRFQLIKRNIGSWSRLLNMVGDPGQYDGTAVVAPVETSTPEPETTEEIVEEIVVEEEAPKPVVEEKKPVKG